MPRRLVAVVTLIRDHRRVSVGWKASLSNVGILNLRIGTGHTCENMNTRWDVLCLNYVMLRLFQFHDTVAQLKLVFHHF